MRISYYRLPQELTAREQYRILKAEGWCNRPEPPKELTDEEILECMGINHQCSISTAKAMMKKYGGCGWTEHYERDGGLFEVTPIKLTGNNSRFKYNRHL